jgi:CHAT domain-containing protein
MHSILAIAAFGLLGTGSIQAAPEPGALQLPADLAGEPCVATGAVTAGQPLSIACGAVQHPAGQVTLVPLPPALPADADKRHAALAALLKGGQDELSCNPPDWVQPGDQAVMVCSLASNGWPRVVLGVTAAGNLYRAEGVPAALPALEGALASVSKTQNASAGQAVLRAVQAKLPAETLKASAGDYGRFGELVEKARLAASADDYAGAESDYREALGIETRLFGPDSFVVGQTVMELALQVSNQGRFSEAAALFRRAAPIVQGSSSDTARARLASYRALDAANQRNYADALKYAREASALRRTQASANQPPAGSEMANVPQNQGELAHSLRIEASMALRLGDLAAARAAAEEALWIVSQEQDLPLWWRPDTVSLMGDINERDGRVVAAEKDFRDARDLDKTLFGDTIPTALADFRLGRFYSDQQLYAPAIEAYHAGFAILANQRGARPRIVADEIVPFVAAASAGEDAATRGADIFRAIQLINSGVADQSIARVAAREAAGNPALSQLIGQAQNAADARDKAQVDLAAEYAKSDDERSRAREQQLESDVKLASARADELFGRVTQQFPDYAKLAHAGPAGLKDVQAQLRPDEALLSYVIGVRSSYAVVVTANSLSAVPLEVKKDQLADDIADLRSAFVPSLRKLPEFSLKNAQALYAGLVAPLASHLAGIDRLVVIPGSTLDNIPFALLVTEPPREGQGYAQAAWLVRRWAVTQEPSARAFETLRSELQQRAVAARQFLGVGNPSFAGASGPAGAKALASLADSCRTEGPIARDVLRALPPLPETAHEIDAVSRHFVSAALLTGARATESNLRAQPLDQYNILYFATHGLLPGELHCASEASLALSPPPTMSSSTNADGLLTASEIAQLKLNADLVVLSACNTANTPGGDSGGALQGLADSFFAAGARAVLASYWQVPSASTERLMIGVFDNARGSADLAQALRQAQLALISQPATAHPFYWAAFSLIGDSASAPSRALASTKATP